MNALLERFGSSNLAIVAFPCNQFGHQEPGSGAEEILNGLRCVRPGDGFEPDPNVYMAKKADINGDGELPVYTYLKGACRFPPQGISYRKQENFWEPIRPYDISWNFAKFIVSPNGVPLYRIHPRAEPKELVPLLEALLQPATDLPVQERQIADILDSFDDTVSRRMAAKMEGGGKKIASHETTSSHNGTDSQIGNGSSDSNHSNDGGYSIHGTHSVSRLWHTSFIALAACSLQAIFSPSL